MFDGKKKHCIRRKGQKSKKKEEKHNKPLFLKTTKYYKLLLHIPTYYRKIPVSKSL